MKNINIKKKYHKKYIYTFGITNKKNKLYFGNYGVIANNTVIYNSQQLETIRILLRRSLGKKARIWLHAKKKKPITTKPIGVRMGKGKGTISHYIFIIQKDEVIFEIKIKKKAKKNIIDIFKKTNRKSNIEFKVIYVESEFLF